MPESLGEVAGGVIGGKLYLVGEGSGNTLAYDLATGGWTNALAPRPHVGDHHSAETFEGRLYLIGGFHGGSEGRVQVYDPASDTWSVRASMPWPGGSVSTCRIGARIYAAGGIVGSTTVDHCAVYNVLTDTWTPRASMPAGQGRNHAAAETDGQRFWIFGGRGVGSGDGNWVANGFDTVLVYDPFADAWASSLDPGSGLAPLPQKRGGMGKAVWLGGEFYVIGGETIDGGGGATSQGVYARVDVYDPFANTWRTDTPMPTARHGLYPVRVGSSVYVAGGGTAAGFSASAVLEVFTRP
jgi:N-acetylneuraminic acid mutarotase